MSSGPQFGVLALVLLSLRVLQTAAQASVPPCVLNCAEVAAESVGCVGSSAIPCICYSFEYNELAAGCIEIECTFQEQQEAVNAYDQDCYPYTILTETGPGPTLSESPSTIRTDGPITLTLTATLNSATSIITTTIDPETETTNATALQQPTQSSVGTKPGSSSAVPAAVPTKSSGAPERWLGLRLTIARDLFIILASPGFLMMFA